MLPINLVETIRQELSRSRREPDQLLHASSDLVGSLRHAQLRIAGAPKNESELISDVRLMTGTLWHQFLHDAIVRTGVPFMQEINVNAWLPEGWGGTPDWIFWDADAGGFVLGDLKTIKGEGMRWIDRDGAKLEHLWQLSAYWHALYDMGLPLVKGFAVLYLPMNAVAGEEIEPTIMECEPIERSVIWGVMNDRWAATVCYLAELRNRTSLQPESFVNECLAPPMEREQKVFWNAKQEVFDLKLVPHWSAQYCPFDDVLCDCSSQGVTKIGHYTVDGEYVPRSGYELDVPAVTPTAQEYRKRREATSQLSASQ